MRNPENAFIEWLARDLFEKFGELFLGGSTRKYSGNISKRDYRGRNANRKTIKFTLESWNGQGCSFRGTGGSWHDIFSSRTCFTKVLRWRIEQTLRTSVRMYCGHHSFFDAKIIFKYLHNWRNTVRSTRSVRKNFIFLGDFTFIDPKYDSFSTFTLSRSRNHYLASAGSEMSFSFFWISEETSGFNYYIYT